MLYPVKILNRKGTIKKEISPQQLSKKHWNKFFDSSRKNIQVKTKKISRKLLDQQLGLEYDSNFYSED